MKKQIILGIVIALAAAFILQNVYLWGRRSGERAQKHTVMPYPHQQPLMPRSQTGHPAFDMERQSRQSLEDMKKMQEDLRRMMNQALPYGQPDTGTSLVRFVSSGAAEHFSETETAYILKIDLPGFEKKDIRLRLDGRRLMVSAAMKEDETKKDGDSFAQTARRGDFVSTFTLPEDAQVHRVTSEYKNGTLTITIPKIKARHPSNSGSVLVR